jgi:1-acyl-sn-glycerol-3-phosphate acyltransferase
MLDIQRLQRIRLSRRPLAQRAVGQLLRLNYGLLPGVRIEFEHAERIPSQPVIYAMNHTDRYNYFPFQVYLWQHHDRFTSTWVKGKYYENSLLATFMEKTNQLPTVSRGYIITKDFVGALRRKPTDVEYQTLRRWVDSAATGAAETHRPPSDAIPEALLSQSRDVLGYAFDSAKEDYASYINAIFGIMMKEFVALNESATETKLDILIFPQGTRATRLLPAKVGISQIALHTRLPIVPVGCNGSDGVYPGGSPVGKQGHIIYRIGQPIPYSEYGASHSGERFEPFSPQAETQHRSAFESVAELVTSRIDPLLDEQYRLSTQDETDATPDTDRFI